MATGIEKKGALEILADLLIFLAGLAFVWWAGWSTTELVWGLWLSSLVVGYLTIFATIGGLVVWGGEMVRSIPDLQGIMDNLGVRVALGVFLLGFFSVHFGIFHIVQAIFLISIFSLPDPGQGPSLLGALLGFVPVIALFGWGERRGIARAARALELADPYKNVARMILVILIFSVAKGMGTDHFLLFAVVYVIYFSPFQRSQSSSADGGEGFTESDERGTDVGFHDGQTQQSERQ